MGSGKSFAFQIGALIHAAYHALAQSKAVRILLLYPRVVLAANQFQDLESLLERVNKKLGIDLGAPILDAGGQLAELAGAGGEPVRGALFQAIRGAYRGSSQILISNLDTLANRLVHPEAVEGLTKSLDLIVFDEVHLLSGLYGAHARMLLKRLTLLRGAWAARANTQGTPFKAVLDATASIQGPYLVGASATIAEPCQHFARLTSTESRRVLHLDVRNAEETGWVHHVFLRQRPEASSMTAAINAVSCLIHNRRDGLQHEYYANNAGEPVALHQLGNPVQPGTVVAKPTQLVHKTIGFSDSLDGVNRWADLVLDNERSKSDSMSSSPNPAASSMPYFVRFQEPLWRVVHHLTFGETPKVWHKQLFRVYGNLCRDCKRGILGATARVPDGLNQAQRDAVERLWDFTATNKESYLSRLEVAPEHHGNPLFAPVVEMAAHESLQNLDRCGFLKAGLCWWWSQDHLGNNHPEPASWSNPVAGFKRPIETPERKYLALNAVRARAFTSKSEFDSRGSINDIFRASPRRLFRDKEFAEAPVENCSFLIGSPRIEVGVDLSRVSDGVTFRAMRDPASLQQKVGRVGRERQSDSLIVHVVTDNARDHFYVRNPRIALDPDYLQPIPLHEGNQIVARNHYFMALFDFMVLQGANPVAERPSGDADRVALVNDHKNARSFSGWDAKVRGLYEFLFAGTPSSERHLGEAKRYLAQLGAVPDDIEASPRVTLTPADAPASKKVGALDILRHEFGPNFLLTQIPYKGRTVTLAEFCASTNAPPFKDVPGLPRHTEFLKSLPQEEAPKNRSYLYQLLTQPLFRRGIPLARLPGDQPFLWTPNFFDAVGKEYVRVFEKGPNWEKDLAYETLGMALSLLAPGSVSYRYKEFPQKVPVSSCGGTGVSIEAPELAAVRLEVGNEEYFEPANCDDLTQEDLPSEFRFEGTPVPVLKPRQIGLLRANSEPLITSDGLLADGDERGFAGDDGIFSLPTPPRCFALSWYRVGTSPDAAKVPCRVAERFSGEDGAPLQSLELPPVARVFQSIVLDRHLNVTEFVWGLDRHFMTRQVDAARLVYREAGEQGGRRIALGHNFETVGLRFDVSLGDTGPVGRFLRAALEREDTPAHQALLAHALTEFLGRFAKNPAAEGAEWWVERTRPSVFTVRNLKTIIWFHLLERWHPAPDSKARPSSAPTFRLDDFAGCFTSGHANFIDEAGFERACRLVASVQSPEQVEERVRTLLGHYPNFVSVCEEVANFGQEFVTKVGQELLLNGLGITLQEAALRVTGAEDRDLAYFYKVRPDNKASIFLFDADEMGNGTVDLVARNFYVSPVERLLSARLRAMGGQVDPLPTIDFMDALEDALQECDTSQAAHLAFHGLKAEAKVFEALESARRGERLIAGPVFDFIRDEFRLPSFDNLLPFQACPEFLVHASRYPVYGSALVPTNIYPNFQSLESGMGFCVDGCVSCIVAPEQNIHGPLSAKDSVSKMLMDAFFRSEVCESDDEVCRIVYPGTGQGRTEGYAVVALRAAEALGRSPSGYGTFKVELKYGDKATVITVMRATSLGPWSRVFRPTWGAAPVPSDRVRLRMPL